MKKLLIITLLAVQDAAAQPTIDGIITPADGYVLIYQNLSSNLGFGVGNRLGALYYAYRSLPSPTMYIGITGSINDANNIVLFLDFNSYSGRGTGTMAGGTSSSLGVFTTNSTSSCGSTGGVAGARMSSGFDADYIFAFNRGWGNATIFADVMRLSTNAPPINGYMEHANVNVSGLPNQSGTPQNLNLPFTALPCVNPPAVMRLAFRNDYDPVTNPNVGIEFALSVNGMCGIAEGDFVRFFVAITNHHGFFSNVTLPALPNGEPNLGCNPNLSGYENLYTSLFLLPFQFSNEEARAEGDAVRLRWNLTGNTHVKKMEVQHSRDGVRFTTIGTVQPVNTEGDAAYSFLHETAVSGKNYYRVRAIDANGKAALSRVAGVVRKGSSTGIVITPNPVTGSEIRLQTTNLVKGVYQVKVLAADGREMLRRQVVHDGVLPYWLIHMNQNLPSGLYWLHVSDANGHAQHQLKFVKQ
ncbi:MAG: T9SS type A sorting domain-containing protein [Lacibacter sp.]|jgi:hypothetical protein